ncbi:MFS transporter, DHA1 family, bicyclomycin/chloramphenicol resistance protein [Desulfuromusa kysingii]|uniref:MFS transporter, DHA1 family, bicyclomycin/chloramphenicol resistance protein n=1 Tax=Desulfuromusa kysingii TaxID=37625 RepID=A0A1H4AZH4_9BACT|nr:multidrug effflux MFS transporter [Desulfuromusa kysingii]SEA41197.1 MFS transporter, DHA1 family, bicyclomycin/chloramphenicol resistance protein [Desulfuromusa kysingii]
MKKLRQHQMLLLLTLLTAFPPLSTDMYLPALPYLEKIWQEPTSSINLTLSGFFIGYCLSLLLYGPLSDKYGRRIPLLVGISVYIVASFLSGFANGVATLTILRILQGAGAAAGSTIAMAITKDLYQGHERQRILAYMGIIMALAPMLAPVIGGWIMTGLTWHWVFYLQAVIGLVALGGVFRMAEPLSTPSSGGVLAAMGMYLKLLRNSRYVALIVLFSFIVLPHFSFIGSAAHIYITRFGLSEQVFGYLFAFNAMAIMAGSFTFSRVQKLVTSRTLLAISFAGILLSGILMSMAFIHGPWGLAAPMALASFSFGLSRPPSNHIVLEQVDQGAGAASSLMVFLYFIAGAFSMWFISLDWNDTIQVIARLACASGGIVLLLWLLFPCLGNADRQVPCWRKGKFLS